MSRVLVWRSDADGKLFEDKKKYQSHLRKLARRRREQKKFQLEKQQAHDAWQRLYNLEIDISQWPQMVIDNQKLFWDAASKTAFHDWDQVGKRKSRGVVLPCPELLEFTVFRVSWSDMVSNTHSCPHDGVPNWDGRAQLPDGSLAPRGYPGWSGRIEWIVKWPKEFDGMYLGSDLFRGYYRGPQRAYTGTGGGGHSYFEQKHKCNVQKFGYDFRLYAADWPGMAKVHNRKRVWKIVSDRDYA